jgi:hypothetical protein
MKREYWVDIWKEHERREEKACQHWEKLFTLELNKEKKKVIEKVNLMKEVQSLFSEILKKIKSVLEEKVVKPAKLVLEKEAKMKRKKIRRKWKKLLCTKKDRGLELKARRLDRKRIWRKFEDQRKSAGQLLKHKIEECVRRGNERNAEHGWDPVSSVSKRELRVISRQGSLGKLGQA